MSTASRMQDMVQIHKKTLISRPFCFLLFLLLGLPAEGPYILSVSKTEHVVFFPIFSARMPGPPKLKKQLLLLTAHIEFKSQNVQPMTNRTKTGIQPYENI